MIIINNNDVDEMENLKNYLTSNSKFDMKDLEGKSIFQDLKFFVLNKVFFYHKKKIEFIEVNKFADFFFKIHITFG